MKNKIKKIITATVISAVSLTTLGAATHPECNKNKDSIQNYSMSQDVKKASAYTPNKNVGKIVETSSGNQIQYLSNDNQIQFLNNDINEAEFENNISLPSSIDGLNLFVLSTTPYINFSSEDNELKLNVKFTNNKSSVSETSSKSQNSSRSIENDEKLNTYNLKRSMLLIYANEIYNNNVNLSSRNKVKINKHIELLSNTNETESSIETKISAIDSIINIIESNLTSNSIYYQKNTYANINNLFESKTPAVEKISRSSSNQEIANKIACVLNGNCALNQDNTIEFNQTTQKNNENNTNSQNRTETKENTTNNNNNNQTNTTNNTNNQNTYNRNNTKNQRNQLNSNITNNISNNQINTSENNDSLRSINTMQETKTMRADRTNENITQEQYISNNQIDGQASRMPYKSTSNFQR